MSERSTEQDPPLGKHETIVRDIILGQGPIHVADLEWYRVLPPPMYLKKKWHYPAIAAVTKPDRNDYAVLVTRASALMGNPRHIHILGFDSTEARIMGLDLEATEPQPPLSEHEVMQRLKDTERGAYVPFYVSHDGYITGEQPALETYTDPLLDNEGSITLRALAAWRDHPLYTRTVQQPVRTDTDLMSSLQY